MKHRQTGLTLLEMMVVLMIAGMALALGFQSLGQWHRAEATLDRVGRGASESALTEAWWRASVRALSAQADAPIKGDAQRLSGLTTSPVLGNPGITPTLWALSTSAAAGTLLTLTEQGQTLELPLPEASKAEFRYLDASGTLRRRWPPELGAQEALPAAVALVQTLVDGSQKIWIATPIGSPIAIFQPFELETD